MDYRKRVYEKCSTKSKFSNTVFDTTAADRRGRAFDYYFRDWVPERKSARIADLGCGGGDILYFFKKRGYENVTGVDISSDQVHLARQVVAGVVEGNVLNFLDLHPEQFEFVIGLDIIEHFLKRT